MSFDSTSRAVAVLAAMALVSAASAQFTDDFEAYTTGSAMEGQAGWQNWNVCATGNMAFNTELNGARQKATTCGGFLPGTVQLGTVQLSTVPPMPTVES